MDGSGDGSRSSLIEQAAQFLQHPDTRDAPRARKAAFLAAKGLQPTEIDQLLDVPPAHAASEAGADTANEDLRAHDPWTTTDAPLDEADAAAQVPPATAVPDPDDTGAPSTPPTPPNPTADVNADPPAVLPPSPAPAPSQPPIITYPEFLARAPAARAPPRPLLAHPAVGPALSAAAGLAAVAYAAHALLLRPMHEALTAARAELLATAQDSLDRLNKQLEGAVSRVPPAAAAAAAAAGPRRGSDAGGSEGDEPTELFQRDVGVQTEREPSAGAEGTYAEEKEEAGKVGNGEAAIDAHEARLRVLQAHAAALRDADRAAAAAAEGEAGEAVREWRLYLDRLALGQASGAAGAGPKGEPGGEDEVARVRAEIRGVKGLLLGARSFPRGVVGRARAFENG